MIPPKEKQSFLADPNSPMPWWDAPRVYCFAPFWAWMQRVAAPAYDPYDILLDTDDPKGMMVRLIIKRQQSLREDAENLLSRHKQVRMRIQEGCGICFGGVTNRGNGLEMSFDEFVEANRQDGIEPDYE